MCKTFHIRQDFWQKPSEDNLAGFKLSVNLCEVLIKLLEMAPTPFFLNIHWSFWCLQVHFRLTKNAQTVRKTLFNVLVRLLSHCFKIAPFFNCLKFFQQATHSCSILHRPAIRDINFGQRLFTAHPHVARYILFETRTGDEKDDNNSLRRFGVLHLLQREE